MNQQVYLNWQLIIKNGISPEVLQYDTAQFLRKFSGVASTRTAYNFETKGYENGLQRRYQNGFYEVRSGDVYIELKPGWLDTSGKTGTSHGSPYSYDTHVPLLFYGRNIPHVRTVRKIVISQIAPTISALLNITFPSGSDNIPLVFK